MISDITDKIIPEIQEWQKRKLERVYPIVFIDATHFHVRDNGQIVCRYDTLTKMLLAQRNERKHGTGY